MELLVRIRGDVPRSRCLGAVPQKWNPFAYLMAVVASDFAEFCLSGAACCRRDLERSAVP